MLTNRYSAAGSKLRALGSSSPSGASPAVRSVRSMPFSETSSAEKVTASMMDGSGFDIPVNSISMGGVSYNKFFSNILPDHEEALIPYYRDCYYFDSVAGATVDLMSVFPFSDWSLIGLQDSQTEIYTETLSRLNIRSLMGEVSSSYLVDGAFIGSLVYDTTTKSFVDVLVHDRLNCSLSLRPFFGQDPVITANSAPNLQNFLNSGSPYVDAVMETYPRAFLETFLGGSVVLDPVTTLFVPRRGMLDQRTTSYLRRVLPMYMLEKTMYRGTLVETTKRMRATTHVQVGTDSWEPTPSEMQTVLSNFQLSEADPLGGWVVTRQGVNVQDIRQGGDFFKWTDIIDTMVPYKLRALGISEAFLAGDANIGNSEAALQVFMESCAAYRSYLNQKLFTEKIFPLIAVSRGLYKDKSKAAVGATTSALLKNLGDHSNLAIPRLHWHKRLDNHDPQKMDVLTTLGEKGIPVPLKMWAAAADVDLDMLLGDLAQDHLMRSRIEAITGKKIDDAAGEDGMGFEGAALQKLERDAEVRSTKNPVLSRRRSILQRSFVNPNGTEFDAPVLKTSKSGNKFHSIYNERAASMKQNEMISKACANLRDPEHRKRVRERIISKVGYMPTIPLGGGR